MTKSLGQIGFEAGLAKYIEQFPDKNPLPWDALGIQQQERHEAIAQAVKAAVLGWRPISEAPREGFIDLWEDGERFTGCWWDRVCAEYRTTGNRPALIRIVSNPTHYMLPPPDPQPEPRADVAPTENAA
jgi:hypothetical protein